MASEEPKQVIIIRKDLNMRKGKIAAQAAHASMKVLLDMMDEVPVFDEKEGEALSRSIFYKKGGEFDHWLNGRFTKICVSVNSEKELMEIYSVAMNNSLPCSLIIDAGLTEFGGIPTKTCVAIGPCWPKDVDRITKHLPLL